MSSSNSSNSGRLRNFVEQIADTTEEIIEKATYHVETKEREEFVMHQMRNYQQNYPKEWEELDSTARGPENVDDGKISPPVIHVSWHEDSNMKSPKIEGYKGRRVNVAKSIAPAQKALCFGSITPEKGDFVKTVTKTEREERSL
ncbi:hypothetical protein DSL72_003391 [Monilinia vaccinii-corymbosi]|uniref:Uncharacterized protein n=1 Tax=Monilinia vaccinii-corymbosi TaxID=61207 RepID=A0A8A3P131_9HELO|nr:hypothetical protein DSL72_003391 [Monilinia vaccinii-corymbosi]